MFQITFTFERAPPVVVDALNVRGRTIFWIGNKELSAEELTEFLASHCAIHLQAA